LLQLQLVHPQLVFFVFLVPNVNKPTETNNKLTDIRINVIF